MIKIKGLFNIKNFIDSDDAVAEVLDFVSIIGILILSFSIIGIAGYPVLKSAQETRYIENTRLSFIVLAENMNKIALGQAPSKSIELKLYGGSLSTTGENTIVINATVYNSSKSPPYDNLSFSTDLRSIENSVENTVVAYEGTGVWIKYPNGVVLNAYRPLIINQGNMLVIPVVTVYGNSSVSGNGMSRINAKGIPDITFWRNASNIEIRFTGNYIAGWKDYFENINDMKWDNVSFSNNNYTAKLNTTTNLDVYILNTDLYTRIE